MSAAISSGYSPLIAWEAPGWTRTVPRWKLRRARSAAAAESCMGDRPAMNDQDRLADGRDSVLRDPAGRGHHFQPGMGLLDRATNDSVDIRPGIPPSSALRCIHLDDGPMHRIPGAGH
jgi:hypothetical protein